MSSDDDVDEELAELREQTDPGTRAAEATPDDSDELEDAIVATLRAIDRGEVSKTLSLRDERLTALVRGLEETDDLDAAGQALREHLDRDDTDEIDRSEFLRLAVRAGLQEAAPDVLDTAKQANGRYAAEQF